MPESLISEKLRFISEINSDRYLAKSAGLTNSIKSSYIVLFTKLQKRRRQMILGF